MKGTKYKRFPPKECTIAYSIPLPSLPLFHFDWKYVKCVILTKYCIAGKTKWNKTKRRRSVAYLISLPQVGEMYCKVDVKKIPPPDEKHRGQKKPFTPEKKHKHFVELKLWNKKKNIELKYHAYSISKLRNEIHSKIRLNMKSRRTKWKFRS